MPGPSLRWQAVDERLERRAPAGGGRRRQPFQARVEVLAAPFDQAVGKRPLVVARRTGSNGRPRS